MEQPSIKVLAMTQSNSAELDIDSIERYLRNSAAEKCVADADKHGWTEVSSGVYLNTSSNITADQADWDEADAAKGLDFSKASYWITTDDGRAPMAIIGAGDDDLRELVDVDAALSKAADRLDARDALAKVAQAGRPEAGLASVEAALACQTRGRSM